MFYLLFNTGDYHHTDHCKSQPYIVKSNIESDTFWVAYRAGSNLLGINLIDDHCIRNDILPNKIVDKLRENGLDPEIIDGIYSYDDTDTLRYSISTEMWVRIICFVVKLAIPEFDYEIIFETMDIGGYGLLATEGTVH